MVRQWLPVSCPLFLALIQWTELISLFFWFAHSFFLPTLPLPSAPLIHPPTLSNPSSAAEQRYCHKMAQIWQTCYSPAHSEAFMRNVAAVPLCGTPLGRLTKGPDYFPGSNISQSVAHNCDGGTSGSQFRTDLNEKKMSCLKISFLLIIKNRLCTLRWVLCVYTFKPRGFSRVFFFFHQPVPGCPGAFCSNKAELVPS